MRRRHLLLAPAVVAVSAAACGDDPARPEESPIDAVAGEYALVGWCG